MAASSIPVGTTGEKLQTWENNIGGEDVHTEAVTLTDSSGVERDASNPQPVTDQHTSTGDLATEVKQDVQIANFGAPADAAATTDTGTFSLIALMKRLLARFNAGTIIGAVQQSGVWTVARSWTLSSGTDSVTTVPSGTQTVAGTVTANQGTSPWVVSLPTGAATAAKQPDVVGAWGYVAGTSGTENIPSNKRILQITASAPTVSASITINGGDTITVPAGKNITFEPKANLVAPTIVFTGTDAYVVEFVE